MGCGRKACEWLSVYLLVGLPALLQPTNEKAPLSYFLFET